MSTFLTPYFILNRKGNCMSEILQTAAKDCLLLENRMIPWLYLYYRSASTRCNLLPMQNTGLYVIICFPFASELGCLAWY